jgi:hypothetical protein
VARISATPKKHLSTTVKRTYPAPQVSSKQSIEPSQAANFHQTANSHGEKTHFIIREKIR